MHQEYLWHTSGISQVQVYLKQFSGLYRAYLRHISGKYQLLITHMSGIYQNYLRHISGVYQEYLRLSVISRPDLWYISGISQYLSPVSSISQVHLRSGVHKVCRSLFNSSTTPYLITTIHDKSARLKLFNFIFSIGKVLSITKKQALKAV